MPLLARQIDSFGKNVMSPASGVHSHQRSKRLWLLHWVDANDLLPMPRAVGDNGHALNRHGHQNTAPFTSTKRRFYSASLYGSAAIRICQEIEERQDQHINAAPPPPVLSVCDKPRRKEDGIYRGYSEIQAHSDHRFDGR
jgi:hypothetical protein